MSAETLAWTLASTFFAGVALFLQKVVAEERRSSAFNGLVSYGTSGGVALLLAFSLSRVPEHWQAMVLLGLAAGAAHGLGNFLRIESLKYIDSVIFFPLHKIIGPLLVVIGGIAFFHDDLRIWQYIGVTLSLTVPLLLISSAERLRQSNLMRGLQFMAYSSFLSAAAVLFSKQGLLYPGAVILVLITSQFAGTLASALILVRTHGLGSAMVSHADRRDMWLGIWSGVISFVSSYCLFRAIATGFVSLVYVIQAHYILIPIILSVWWYKDHIDIRKFAAVVVSFLAITLLAL